MVRTKALILAAVAAAILGQRADAAPTKRTATKAATPKPQVSKTGTLRIGDLMLIATAAINPPDEDAFRSRPPSPHLGRSFSINQALRPYAENDFVRNGTWHYDKAAQAIELEMPYEARRFGFYRNVSNKGRRVGQNAYGVKVAISSLSVVEMSVASVSPLHIGRSFFVKLPAGPEAAKALSSRAVVRIEGDLVGRDGEVAVCDLSEDEATITSPTEIKTISCDVYVRVRRVAILDGEKVLTEKIFDVAK